MRWGERSGTQFRRTLQGGMKLRATKDEKSAMHVAWGGVLHAEEGVGTQCLQRTDRKVVQWRPDQARQGTHGAGGRGRGQTTLGL